MLNENELQCLIGLLYFVSEPDGVAVEVGARVLDVSTGTERDVDVTIRYARDGSDAGLAALEVKEHGRALDVTHVEQLTQKLSDMPSLASRGIVSASGYTAPAIRKAERHGIELLHFVPWNPLRHGFGNCTFPPEMPFSFLQPRWAEGPIVQLYSEPQRPQADFVDLDQEALMPGGRTTTLRAVTDQAAAEVSRRFASAEPTAPGGAPNPVEVPTTPVQVMPQPMLLRISGESVRLVGITVRGRLEWDTHKIPTSFHMLQKEGDEKPHIGCVVADLPALNLLVGIVSGPKGVSIVSIGPEQRKKRPFKLKL